jgi:hypothetical protein
MNLFAAVFWDLADFASKALFGVRIAPLSHNEGVIYVAPRPERLALQTPLPPAQPTVAPPHAHLETVFEKSEVTSPQRNTIAYIASSGAPLRSSPEYGVDNVFTHMPFGAMVVAVETKGEWVRIFHAGVEGYVELADLADRAAYVHPSFTIGETNEAHDPTTERVRAMIENEFSYGEGELPLQAEEYVLYKLRRNGIVPSWPHVRPRVPGAWATILKGATGVAIETVPSPRSVLEYEYEGKGHLAFVEAVFPDETIQVSEANWPEGGIYNERVLVKEEWKLLHPTFIRFVA